MHGMRRRQYSIALRLRRLRLRRHRRREIVSFLAGVALAVWLWPAAVKIIGGGPTQYGGMGDMTSPGGVLASAKTPWRAIVEMRRRRA